MYNWLVWLHITSAFLFMLAHGVRAAAMLKFGGEPDPEKSLTFFNIVPEPTLIRWLTFGMGVSAFSAVLVADWWSEGWVWLSAAVFLVITFVMYRYGAGYYALIETAATRAMEARKANQDAETALQA